jgi:hypothetical protein
LPEQEYERIRAAAQADLRSISNYIRNATLHMLEHEGLEDRSEEEEILADKELQWSLTRGRRDYRAGRYRIVPRSGSARRN